MTVTITEATPADIPHLNAIAARMAGHKAEGYFEKCFSEKRVIFIAEDAGYVQLNLNPNYESFRRQGLFEVQDLAVAPESRNRGIGEQLVAACEAAAKKRGATAIGISVGLYNSYGPAQRLYVRMGYVPDGAGIAYDDIPVRPGEMRMVDDELTLKMVKNLV